jgi:phosphoglucomutase
LGHNGLKFGFAGDGVLPGSKAAEVAARFERLLNEPERRAEIAHLTRGVSAETVRGVYEEVARLKPRAVSAYRAFALEVADWPAGDGAARTAIAAGVAQDGCGVVVDFNGSARATSIDASLLQELGIRTATLNDAPRAVAHQILPEGPGLDPARAALTERAAADASYTLAYVPDNDGDRGNVVFAGAETALDAQEVFALAVVAELAWLSASGLRPTAEQPWAVVVNGPTSLRIERIAAAFDAEVHRCEVGEANVVETAARLRDAGYLVRILGEGSNGGNILHPSAVRDPIATVGAFLKLLYAYRGTERDLFGEWCSRSNNETRYRSSFTLEDVRATLPAFRTTATGRPKAKLAVRTRNYSELKRRYREVFDEEWRSRQAELARTYHVVDYEEIRYEGTTSRVMPKGRGAVPASGRGSVGGAVPAGGGPGGLKIQLYDHDGRAVAFLWMRGSGTEPVFRAVVDIEGTDQAAEEQLLDWHRSMIERADRLAAGR